MTIEPHPYRNEDDLERIKGLLITGRKAKGPTYYVHVGDLDWWLRYLYQDDLAHVLYWWEGDRADGQLIGWSLFSPRVRAFDVFVHPDEQGNDLARQMWIWTEEKMSEIVREQGGDDLRTMWVSEQDAGLIAYLEHRGFIRSDYHLVCMTRSLDDPIPDPPLPTGYHVRHVAGEYEVGKRAAVAHATFKSRQPFELYRERYRTFMRSPAYTQELDLVVVTPDGRFGAFCICWLDKVNTIGLFEPVGTGPDFRRKGMGRVVLCEGMRRMKDRGMKAAMVCVEADNLAAQCLYRSVGFCAVHKILTFAKKI